MIPTTPNTQQNPPVSGPLSRQVRSLRMTLGPTEVQSKMQQPVNLREKRLEMQDNGHSHACLRKSLTHVRNVALATHVREFTSDMYYVLTLSP